METNPPRNSRSGTHRDRGVEFDQVAAARGRIESVIAGLPFMAGMRRSKVIALAGPTSSTPPPATARWAPTATARRSRWARPGMCGS